MKLPKFVKNPYVAGSVLAGGGAIDAATHEGDTPLGDVAMGLGAATLLAPLLRGKLGAQADKLGRASFDKNMAKRQDVMDAKTAKVEELLAKRAAAESQRNALRESQEQYEAFRQQLPNKSRNDKTSSLIDHLRKASAKEGGALAKKGEDVEAARAAHTAALGDANRFRTSMRRKNQAREERNNRLVGLILGSSGVGTALGADYVDPFGGETL